jgi:hypothetical protein
MKSKILGYLLGGLNFLVFKILLIDLGLFLLVWLSFQIWKPFSITAFSERLVLTGLGIALVAGLLVFSQTSGGRTFGVPGQFMGSVHGQSLIDFNIEARKAIETKMGIYPRMFIIGAILFGLGALVQVMFS